MLLLPENHSENTEKANKKIRDADLKCMVSENVRLSWLPVASSRVESKGEGKTGG
jgi:hypothetical protein